MPAAASVQMKCPPHAGTGTTPGLAKLTWIGPGLVSLAAIVGISILQPSFLSPFNVFVLLFFIVVGARYLLTHPALISTNWHPFVPPNVGFGHFGWSGIGRAAAVLFFAYFGFDAVSSAAQEAKNPQKDVQVGLFGSLAICTVLYLLFASVLVGLVNYRNLDVGDPVTVGIKITGLHWGSFLVTLGALGGLTSTILVLLLGISRLLYTMSFDGLLPSSFSSVHPRFKTPYRSSLISGGGVALIAALLPIDFLAEMVSIGVLLAFASVCAGVWVLRSRRPDLPRSFRTPWMPFVPAAGITVSLLLMLSLTPITWMRLGIWFVIGMAIYFNYSRHHSHNRQGLSALEGRSQAFEEEESPERELILKVLNGVFAAFATLVGIAALFSGLSVFFPAIERNFQFIAPLLSTLAIIIGLTYSILPSLQSVWLLRRRKLVLDEESVRELINSLRSEGSDDSKISE